MFRAPLTRFLRRKSTAGLTAAAAVLVAGGSLMGAAPANAAVQSPQQIAHQLIPNASQYAAFSNVVSHESNWNLTARNASSGAYGLGQALPAEKMASFGADWRTNPATQIKWTLSYMNTRYGGPEAAWQHWQQHRSY